MVAGGRPQDQPGATCTGAEKTKTDISEKCVYQKKITKPGVGMSAWAMGRRGFFLSA